ncbi:MAG: FHA domain-containing protein [bacterium]
MAEAGDIIDTIQKGAGLAGKAAVRAVGEISKGFKTQKDSTGGHLKSGIYSRSLGPELSGEMLPALDYFEPRDESSVSIGLLKSLTLQGGERALIGGLRALMQGRSDDAVTKISEAATRDPQMADAYFVLGALFAGEKRFPEAVEVFEKALLCQGALGQKLKKYLPSFRMTLSFSENSAFAFFPDVLGTSLLLALFRRAAGKSDEALRGLEQLLSVLPNHPAILFFIGCLEWEGGQFEKLREQCSSLEPANTAGAACAALLGKTLAALGDANQAVLVLKRALQLEDLDPFIEADLRLALAEALTALGYGADASSELARVSGWNPDFEELTRRLGLVPPAKMETSIKTDAPADLTPIEGAVELSLRSTDGKINVPLFGRKEIVVGREEGDLVLSSDEAVSGRHFRLFFEGGQLWLEDLQSTNGTLVNDHRVSTRVELHRGDRIRAGGTLLGIQ